MVWIPPQIWPNRTAFILGGGPSINNVDFSLLKDQRCIAVNNAGFLWPGIDVLYFGDFKWGARYKEQVKRTFGGLVITSCHRKLYDASGWAKKINRLRPSGIEDTPGYISWNGNSGLSAINLAYHFGAKRIVLVGFDMRPVNGEKNFHREYVGWENTPKDIHQKYLKHIPAIAADAQKLGLEILNATPGSAITQFKQTTIEEILCIGD